MRKRVLQRKKVKNLIKNNFSKLNQMTKTLYLYHYTYKSSKRTHRFVNCCNFSAAMSSTASELNSLAATSTIDLYKRNIEDKSEIHYVNISKFFTLFGD